MRTPGTTKQPSPSHNPGLPVAALTLTLTLALTVGTACGKPPDDARYDRRARPVVVCAAGPTLPGIDVSYWQGTIDWDQVATSGIAFAFIRVSDGLTVLDTQFQANWAEAQRVGIARGAYQFFRPGQDAVAQANLLVTEMGPLEPGDLPPVIDVEAHGGLSPGAVADGIGTWIATVEGALGVRPIIYTGKYFWQDHVQSGDFTDYPLWAAHWGVSCPNLADPWTDWAFHQTSDSGVLPGISGRVDTNLFNGDAADLAALGAGGGFCGDGLCGPDEDAASCAVDCPVCAPIPAAGRIVDDGEVCFERRGTPQWWHPESAGWSGGLWWTTAVDSAVDNVGIWRLDFAEAGRYRIEAYTDGAFAGSRQARYEVHYGGLDAAPVVDQTAVDGWNLVGEFAFAAGGDQWVRLTDLTGEPLSANRTLVFDALRITRIDSNPDPDPDPDPDAGTPPVPDPDPTTSPDAGTPPATTPPPRYPRRGCAIAGDGGAGGPASGLLALLVGALLWRRRRSHY